MATTLFRDTTYTVSGLVEDIRRGDLGLPDIQRPFVWGAAKARDLLDSMYKGFPVGYLLFWDVGAEAGARPIGTDDKQRVPRMLIVDGQQRLTSLYAVMTGTEVVRDDYSQGRIRIAFRPADATFAVTDVAIEKDPEFIADVSALWVAGERRNVERAFLARLAAKRELGETERDALSEAIDRLHDLQHYPFKAVELSASVDEERVAEIFVRINSEGVTLNQADFILTLMSVFWDKGRRELEDFCRASKTPSLGKATPFNWYLQPQPPQLLRVSIAVGFRRAVLKQVYSVLRGRDVDTGRSDPQRRDIQFGKLQAAQAQVLDLTNWHEYLLCLERAGYRGEKMISSDSAVIFTYALWLLGRTEYGVPLDRLREVIARWFFMAHATSRYSGSVESQVERDLAAVEHLRPRDADGFVAVLDRLIENAFTGDYWTITLPADLATSASKSPALLAYIAALNILDADALLSTVSVRARLDPAVTARKGIERHHLFPRAYLKSALGITDTRQINQIANMALVEWADNIAISDTAPATYWPQQLASKAPTPERLAQQVRWHALPEDWTELDYPTFLDQRRKLMAAVVRDAYEALRDGSFNPRYPEPSATPPPTAAVTRTSFGVTLADLVAADLVPAGTTLRLWNNEAKATVLPDGKLVVNDEVVSSLSAAAETVLGMSVNGWTYWVADTPDGAFSLSALRDAYLASKS
ncbi:MAG: DUF262 domain-containing protein [Kineosporiaceae bacterium]